MKTSVLGATTLLACGAVVAFMAGGASNGAPVLRAMSATNIEMVDEPLKNEVTENAEGVGDHGGTCTCPNGEVYQVGDNHDNCASLACVNGQSGTCNAEQGEWSRRKVVCVPADKLDPSCGKDLKFDISEGAKSFTDEHAKVFAAVFDDGTTYDNVGSWDENKKFFNSKARVEPAMDSFLNREWEFTGETIPHIVAFRATDGFGNIRKCNLKVYVLDKIKPVVSGCPSDLIIHASAYSCESDAQTWAAPTCFDNVDETITPSGPGFDLPKKFSVGETTVKYSCTDKSQNVAACEFKVKVVDKSPPTFEGCEGKIFADLEPTATEMCPALAKAAAVSKCKVIDNCGEVKKTTCKRKSQPTVVSGETADTAAEQTEDNIEMTKNHCSAVAGSPASDEWCETECNATPKHCPANKCRCEEKGVAVPSLAQSPAANTAANSAGASGKQTGGVAKAANSAGTTGDQTGGASRRSQRRLLAEPGAANDGTASDGSNWGLDKEPYRLGTTEMECEAEDAAGNKATHTFSVKVEDTTKPSLLGCPGSFEVMADEGKTTWKGKSWKEALKEKEIKDKAEQITKGWTVPTCSDNSCSCTVTEKNGKKPGDELTVGVHDIAYASSDDAGLTATCSFQITVKGDDTVPQWKNCPKDVDTTTLPGGTHRCVTWELPEAEDDSGVTYDDEYYTWVSGTAFPVGRTTIKFTATDKSTFKNQASCEFSVTVSDKEDPSIPTLTAEEQKCDADTSSPDFVRLGKSCGGRYALADSFDQSTLDNSGVSITDVGEEDLPCCGKNMICTKLKDSEYKVCETKEAGSAKDPRMQCVRAEAGASGGLDGEEYPTTALVFPWGEWGQKESDKNGQKLGREYWRVGLDGKASLLKDMWAGEDKNGRANNGANYHGYYGYWHGQRPNSPVLSRKRLLLRGMDGKTYNKDTGLGDNVLWVTDGTSTGTEVLKDICPTSSNQGGFNTYKVPGKDIIYFGDGCGKKGGNAAENTGAELWRTDGTPEGTVMVKDLYPGANSHGHAFGSSPHNFIAFDDDTVLFSARTDVGQELWKTDGTASGTVMVKDLAPGEKWGSPEFFVKVGDKVYFRATTYAGNRGTPVLWETDATAEGTKIVYTPGNGNGWHSLSVLNGNILWISRNGQATTLEKFDPTTGETTSYYKFPTDSSWHGHQSMTVVQPLGLAFFAFRTKENGNELWKTDGTNDGTSMVKDIRPGKDHGLGDMYGGSTFGELGSKLYFIANDGTHGSELWRSDGTAAGTTMVKDEVPGKEGSVENAHRHPFRMGQTFGRMGGKLFYSGIQKVDAKYVRVMYYSDGTTIQAVTGLTNPSGHHYDYHGTTYSAV
jgi:ELWxxDGT repeat protein